MLINIFIIEIFMFNTYSNNFHVSFQKLYTKYYIICFFIFIYIYFKINSNNRLYEKKN